MFLNTILNAKSSPQARNIPLRTAQRCPRIIPADGNRTEDELSLRKCATTQFSCRLNKDKVPKEANDPQNELVSTKFIIGKHFSAAKARLFPYERSYGLKKTYEFCCQINLTQKSGVLSWIFYYIKLFLVPIWLF